MAWPCISRVCCLARFWNQLDKSDLSVPLTTQNYSDITEQKVRSITKQVSTLHKNNDSTQDPRALGSNQAPADGQRTRGSFRSRKEPSYNPPEDYHPFPSITQYKQDFKPWPIPRKENFPWISKGCSRADMPKHSTGNSYHREERCGGQRLREQQGMEEDRQISSYRQEFRPWTGVRPAKSVRRTPPAQYSSPGTEATNILCETSYQAAYSGDTQRSIGTGERIILSAGTGNQPAAAPLPIPSSSHSPSGHQQSVLPEKSELTGTIKGEEHLVRTKLPRNPSAVFQSGSRVFNI